MIDTEILRKKIIDLAIQGKLTQQLPEDGNAEDLYAQIQEEKIKLIKEGKIKKEKPLPEISDDEIPFEIPNTWKWVRWGNIVNVVSARRVHQSDWKKEGIPFYRAREIATLADTGVVNNSLFISEELYEEFSKSGVPHAGDLMVTGVGTLGKTYVVQESERFYYKDASVLCFENYAGMIATFLKQVMESSLMRSQIDSNSGGTTVDTLTMVRMNQYLFPLPPLDEQKRIIEMLDNALAQIDLIDILQQQYESDREILKGKIIDAGIRGKLTQQLPEDGNASDLYAQIQDEKAKFIKEGKIKKKESFPDIAEDEIPFEIPSNWKWVRLGDICPGIKTGSLDANQKDDVGKYPFFTCGEEVYTTLNYAFDCDAILLGGNNASGDYKMHRYNGKFNAYQRVYVISGNSICLDYVFWIIKYWLPHLKTNSQGMTTRFIKIGQVTGMLVPLPPLSEQRRIASIVETILEQFD